MKYPQLAKLCRAEIESEQRAEQDNKRLKALALRLEEGHIHSIKDGDIEAINTLVQEVEDKGWGKRLRREYDSLLAEKEGAGAGEEGEKEQGRSRVRVGLLTKAVVGAAKGTAKVAGKGIVGGAKLVGRGLGKMSEMESEEE